MPGLARSEWYDLTRDMNWTLSYVDQEEAWPQDAVEHLRRACRELVGLG